MFLLSYFTPMFGMFTKDTTTKKTPISIENQKTAYFAG
jgi:hypothetical protein